MGKGDKKNRREMKQYRGGDKRNKGKGKEYKLKWESSDESIEEDSVISSRGDSIQSSNERNSC